MGFSPNINGGKRFVAGLEPKKTMVWSGVGGMGRKYFLTQKSLIPVWTEAQLQTWTKIIIEVIADILDEK
ncbi:MAG: hypothetical protein Fur0025_36260 [Oscillatoriaceae cyanobacterium]